MGALLATVGAVVLISLVSSSQVMRRDMQVKLRPVARIWRAVNLALFALLAFAYFGPRQH